MAIRPILSLLLGGTAFIALGSAYVIVKDPSDYEDLAADASDNAILADYVDATTMYQYITVTGPYYYSGSNVSETLSHETLTVDKNDTSVVVVTEGADVDISYSTIIKEGYSSDLLQASFFGVNSAVVVANGSTATIENTNITVHNGAANMYAYGTGSVIYLHDSDLYSSGPVSHGCYAGGNGTIHARDVRVYSGGNRASSFSGDNPAGYIYVNDSVAHTAGIGSAIFYALGEIHATNVVGLAERAPVIFSDGVNYVDLQNVDLTSNFLAGTIFFSSADRQDGAYLLLNESSLTVTADDQPALWWGNSIASADIFSSEINTASGILVIANRSQVTQDFNHFAGYEENKNILPAEVTITIAESNLTGNLVAMNESSIAWSLTDYSHWTGTAIVSNGGGSINVSLDSTSTWSVTADVTVANLTNADSEMSNVVGNGHTVSYVADSPAHAYLNGKTISLRGGGHLKPTES